MTTVEGRSKHPGHLDRLVQLLVLVVLAGIWAVSIAYAVAERSRFLERAQTQLAATVATLADLNELADMASAKSLEAGNAQRAATIWRALLQYPTSSIWVETDGVVTAGQPPVGDLAAFITAREARPHFAINAALPRADALSEWRRLQWQEGGILAAVTVAFLLLAQFLTSALRRRTIAEREAAAAQEREAHQGRKNRGRRRNPCCRWACTYHRRWGPSRGRNPRVPKPPRSTCRQRLAAMPRRNRHCVATGLRSPERKNMVDIPQTIFARKANTRSRAVKQGLSSEPARVWLSHPRPYFLWKCGSTLSPISSITLRIFHISMPGQPARKMK
jgi:hypothetical protein